MKTTILSIVAIHVLIQGWCADPLPGDNITVTRDIRVVNGTSVDLTPVHEWFRTKEGDRPLKHWKQLQLFTVKDESAYGGIRCVLKTENGLMEAYVKNLPPELNEYIQTMRRQEFALAKLRSDIAAQEAVVR